MLTETVALAHPMIPFETEEIYSYIPGTEGLLARVVPADGSRAPRGRPAEAAIEQVDRRDSGPARMARLAPR